MAGMSSNSEELDKLKSKFQRNLLDGYDIQRGQMLAATEVWDFLVDALPALLANEREKGRLDELHRADRNATTVLYKDDFKQGFAVPVSYIRDRLAQLETPNKQEEKHIDIGKGFTHSSDGKCSCLAPNAKEDIL